MLGPFAHPNLKRTQSVIDQDYDLMGLSRKNADNDESFPFNHGNSMDVLDDLNVDFVKKEGPKLPFNDAIDAEFNGIDPLLLDTNQGPFTDLPDNNAGFGMRHRSMTFNFAASSPYFNLLNSYENSRP